MSDIPASGSKVQQESVQFNNPTSEASQSAIGALANYGREILPPVGSIIASMLDEATFQGQTTNPSPERWVLADGRDVTGSAYQALTSQTNIPDLRGNFIRGKNNGRSDGKQNPDGDLGLGAYTASKFQAHNHGYTDPGHNHGITDPGHSHTVSDPGHTHTVTDPGHNHAITDPQHAHGYSDPTHNHTVNDPGHTHQIFVGLFGQGGGGGNILSADDAQAHSRTYATQSATTGVSNNASTVGITINNAATGITINSHTTGVSNNTSTTGLTVNANTSGISTNNNTIGITIANTGGNETAPENYTINWFIRIN